MYNKMSYQHQKIQEHCAKLLCKTKRCIAITRKGKNCCRCVADPDQAFCRIHQKFVSYSPHWISLVLYDQLRVIKDVFVANRITFWLSFGTLLGAVRHKGLIPWDDDADINVNIRHKKRVEGLKGTFEDLGFNLICDDENDPGSFQLTNLWLPNNVGATESPGTDIFFYKRVRDNGKIKYVYDNDDFPDQASPYPIRMVKFGNFKLPVPNEKVTRQQLDRNYPGWQTTIVIDQWHMNTLGQRPRKTLQLSRPFAKNEILMVECHPHTAGNDPRETPRESQWVGLEEDFEE